MDKLFKKLNTIKLVMGLTVTGFLALGSTATYAYDYLHNKYLKKTELTTIINKSTINQYEIEIAVLEIEKGYSTSKNEMMKYETIIGVKRVQILALKGRQ